MPRAHKRVIDLYATGSVVELKDGSPLWVVPLNPFEQDTARSEAQIAKSRLALAIRTEGSDEEAKVRAWFDSQGREETIDLLVNAQGNKATPKHLDAIRNDPDWTERMEIFDRGAEDTATPLEEEEAALLTRIGTELTEELGRRMNDEREYQLTSYEQMDDDVLWLEFLDWYIDERTSVVLVAEFRLHQILFGVRCCEAQHIDHDEWDHSKCNHDERLFENLREVRTAPEALIELLQVVTDEVDMSARTAKNSHRQGSSSDSSPLPSEEAESTPSTPNETPPAPPGS